ncbi:hypothetical protein [Streptomyces sp. R35]|uniref:Uncharacterized protein n=1 Tax=Streptomyces sp. R35 TaxID=3238630 RepID=A0AB39S3V4_9ACTN
MGRLSLFTARFPTLDTAQRTMYITTLLLQAARSEARVALGPPTGANQVGATRHE